MKIAAALPMISSVRVTGVVSTGSRVPCSRSPTTEYALMSVDEHRDQQREERA